MKNINLLLAGLCLIMAAACNQPENEQMSNEAIENMMSRRSIRAYKSTPVGRDTLTRIMDALSMHQAGRTSSLGKSG